MDMGGWDVVYASGVSNLNKVLATSMHQLLVEFEYHDNNVELKGTFDAWSIRPGGTANRINVQVPIRDGVLNGAGFTNLSLDGVLPVINVALKLVEGKSLPNTQDVTFDIQNVATSTSNPRNGDVYVANPDEGNPSRLAQLDPSGTAAQILRDNLPKCFVQNAAKISYVFASVFSSPTDQPWLKPKITEVAYYGSQDGSEQAVAIKTLTAAAPWDSTGLPSAIDPALLNGGGAQGQMFYSLAKAVFMQNLLLPAIPGAIGNGVPQAAFTFNGPTDPAHQDACSITNTQPFNLPPVDHGGINYWPTINSFSVTVNNTQVVTLASGQFDITGLAGAWVQFDNLQVVNELYYDEQNQRAAFRLVSQTEPSVDKHIPWEYWLLCIFLVGLIIRGIIELVVVCVDNAVQSALTGTGSLQLVTIPTSTAVWNGISSFRIAQADLEQAFVMRG